MEFLEVQPKSLTLKFSSTESRASFTIRNTTATNICYKIKSTAPNRTAVKPSCGYLRCLDEEEAVVIGLPIAAFNDVQLPSREKLLISAVECTIPPDQWNCLLPGQAWRQLDKSKTCDTKLSINFVTEGNSKFENGTGGSWSPGDLMGWNGFKEDSREDPIRIGPIDSFPVTQRNDLPMADNILKIEETKEAREGIGSDIPVKNFRPRVFIAEKEMSEVIDQGDGNNSLKLRKLSVQIRSDKHPIPKVLNRNNFPMEENTGKEIEDDADGFATVREECKDDDVAAAAGVAGIAKLKSKFVLHQEHQQKMEEKMDKLEEKVDKVMTDLSCRIDQGRAKAQIHIDKLGKNLLTKMTEMDNLLSSRAEKVMIGKKPDWWQEQERVLKLHLRQEVEHFREELKSELESQKRSLVAVKGKLEQEMEQVTNATMLMENRLKGIEGALFLLSNQSSSPPSHTKHVWAAISLVSGLAICSTAFIILGRR